jgi:hypothetical protein
MKRDLPMRLFLTVSFSMLFRPTSLRLVFSPPELRTTRVRRVIPLRARGTASERGREGGA